MWSAGCRDVGSSGLGRAAEVAGRLETFSCRMEKGHWRSKVVSFEHQKAGNDGGLSPLRAINRNQGRPSFTTKLLLPLVISPESESALLWWMQLPVHALQLQTAGGGNGKGAALILLQQLIFAPAVLGQLCCCGSPSLLMPGFHFCPSCRHASILCVWFAQSVLITPLTYAVELLVSITAWR